MWRQGDILVQSVKSMPTGLSEQSSLVIERSRATGHRHAIKRRQSAKLFRLNNQLVWFLEVTDDQAELVHPEHDTIELPQGMYRIWKQREFDDFGSRPMWD